MMSKNQLTGMDTNENVGSGKKFDSGKPAMSLIPYKPLAEVAKVLMFGAEKYGRDNWKGGFKYTRLVDAVLRHVNQWKEGEDLDDESGISHLAHAVCGLLFLLFFVLTEDTYKHLDDRLEEK